MELDVTRAESIEGWMTRIELWWLARQAQTHKRIVEVGSYFGRSTCALATYTAGVVYAVDDWLGVGEYPRKNPHLDPLREGQRNFERFTRNVADLLELGRVVPVRCNHAELVWSGELVDMVFIDGNHSAESVRRDIAFWRPFLAEGGLLCGHDIDLDSVKEGVRAELGGFRVAPETMIWLAP